MINNQLAKIKNKKEMNKKTIKNFPLYSVKQNDNVYK